MTTKSIYEKHAAAFSHVSAIAVLKDGEHVANISFKFPKDGANALPVYVHWIGLKMVQGVAKGYGYDKKTGACVRAGEMLKKNNTDEFSSCSNFNLFVSALLIDDGCSFSENLRKNGFTLITVL